MVLSHDNSIIVSNGQQLPVTSPRQLTNWVGFNVPLNTLYVISGAGLYGSNNPTNSVKALKEVVVLRIGFNPTRSTSPCYNTTRACNTYTEMNLSTVKWVPWDKSHSRELLGPIICVCIALCTIVVHNIAQNRADNFPSYPPDNHHCSDDVYLREAFNEVHSSDYLLITFCVSRRRREMYCGHAHLCVCLSTAACPHYLTDPDVTWRSGRGPLSCALLGAFAISARLRCYGNITRKQNVSEYMLVLALCLVCINWWKSQILLLTALANS